MNEGLRKTNKKYRQSNIDASSNSHGKISFCLCLAPTKVYLWRIAQIKKYILSYAYITMILTEHPTTLTWKQ